MSDAPAPRAARVGLVAGWSFPAGVFDPLVRQLAFTEVVSFDWSSFASGWLEPGHGEGAAFAAEPAVWVGWSLGGSLLLEAVRRGNLRPTRLVLVQATPCFLAGEGWPGVSRGEWQSLRRAADRAPRRAAAAFRRRFGLPVEPAADAASAAVEGLDWLAELDLRQALAGIEVPVDVWLAPADPLVPVDWPSHLNLPAHLRVNRFAQPGHAAWLDHVAELAGAIASPR
ncbi:hypothetical protein GM160_02225 [Guyparkeria halophila]|uniref:Alpha/beta fold hydrolase n=1 Tax=Guyparkeria halophila TaxID=47960 RepID=A0A6I6D8P4_9GAMM|nr:hypothetical protein [Guyparkeria halophila]QGT77802.1 hypothetical protein GM160_02225 [Guyparkeria halophila]